MAANKPDNAKILIYDGGMGTTLEDDFEADISSALWSSSLLQDERKGHQTLKALHSSFLTSGANLIQSCTYQCSFEGFKKQGYSESEAIKLMRKAVSLADEAISTCSSATTKGKGKSKEEPKVVLALSCYGAILSPGQEYSGRYPPPFGHHAHSPSLASSDADVSTLSDSTHKQNRHNQHEDSWVTEAEQNLEDWHFRRLQVFASDPETWNKVSYVAFETLPVLYEGRAVRRAMTRLRQYIQQQNTHEEQAHGSNLLKWPKWWISFVFPHGELPHSTSLEHGDVSARSIARTIFKEDIYKSSESEEEVGSPLEVPDGLGINCTKMRYLPEIVTAYTEALQDMPRSKQAEKERILVLYPDGGLVYDPVTKTWHQDGNTLATDTMRDSQAATADPAKVWATSLAHIASSALNDEAGVWEAAILGGCCKASPAYISELSERIAELKR